MAKQKLKPGDLIIGPDYAYLIGEMRPKGKFDSQSDLDIYSAYDLYTQIAVKIDAETPSDRDPPQTCTLYRNGKEIPKSIFLWRTG